MRKNIWLSVVLVLITGVTSYAQYGESIRSGRPGQAIGPFTVGTRVFQVQAGTDVSGSKQDSQDGINREAIDVGSVFRLGLTKKFELGLGINYNSQSIENVNGNEDLSGISAFSIRMRSNVYEGKGATPSVGYQFELGIPIVDREYRSDQLAPKITVVTGQKFGDRWGFVTNWGASWDGNSAQSTGFNILNIGYGLSDKLSLFIEQYGFLNNKKYDSKLDGGLAYLINNDLQLDLHGGRDRNLDDHKEWFVSLGVSWRVRY